MNGDQVGYDRFIREKRAVSPRSGFTAQDLDRFALFPFQRACVEWACGQGRAALFADTGLGKTFMQLAWADAVRRETGGRVLILAPLAVGPQTVREARRFGIDGVAFARMPEDAGDATICVTNYDNLDRWADFDEAGVVLDESSILKSFMGSTRIALTDRFAQTPFRLACSATPAPNDHTELGTHAEWLGICSRAEMLATYFVNDIDGKGGAKTANEWRLKGHAVGAFWDWVASWSRMVGLPSDMGAFDDTLYVLTPLRVHRHIVEVDIIDGRDDSLFRNVNGSATEIKKEQRRTATDRARCVADIVSGSAGPWLIWTETDTDGAAVRAVLPDVVEVHGTDKPETKEARLLSFADGGINALLTKGSIAGLGLNFQRCHQQVFMGLSYSYERFYQQIRRSWRFGQTEPVDAHVVIAATETPILATIQRKEHDHQAMKVQMFAASRRAQASGRASGDYHPTHSARLPAWLHSQETP